MKGEGEGLVERTGERRLWDSRDQKGGGAFGSGEDKQVRSGGGLSGTPRL